MSNKRLGDNRRDITAKMLQKEIRNYSELKCGDYCPFIDLIDKVIRVMAKVRRGVYENVQDILFPTNVEHRESNETIHQQLMSSGLQSIDLSYNIPTRDVLEDYGFHITNRP